MDSKKFPKFKSKAFLAPMSGVTDVAMRALCVQQGAGMTYTEFVSATAVVRDNKTTQRMLQRDSSEKIVATQLFGSKIDELVEAAKILEKRFEVIDLNCGCPATKVVEQGAGSELMNDPKHIAKVISAMNKAIDKPVTLKIRSGLSPASINAMKIAKLAEDAGAAAIAIHGRTVKQGYSGKSDWEITTEIKSKLDIPVIGNGDVTSPEIFKQRLKESGVDAIMIGRAALGTPFIFKQINDYIKTGTYEEEIRLAHFPEYIALWNKYNLPYAALKTQAMHFTKGIKGGSEVRLEISKCADRLALEKLAKSVLEDLKNQED